MSKEQEQTKLSFHFVKSNLFRVIHADGAWGGVTPHSNIHMALYSERQPIPQQVTYEIREGSVLGEELKEERVGKSGIVREIEADVVLDLNAAKSLVEWLQQHIGTLEQLERAQKSASPESS